MTGQMRKSMANFTTCSLGDKNIIRAKAFNPKNAKSEAQVAHRSSFKLIVDEYTSLGGIPDMGFPERSVNQSAYNAFVGINLPEAIDNSGDELKVDYSKLKIANGTLQKLIVTSNTLSAEGIRISYQTNTRMPKVNATDKMVAVAKTKIGEVYIEEQVRGDAAVGSILLPIANVKAEDVICVYLFALSADGTKASKSEYIALV